MLLWLSSDNVRDLLGLSATITTVLQFLTGFLICYSYIKKKSTGEVFYLSFCGFINKFHNFLPFRRVHCPSPADSCRVPCGFAMVYSSKKIQWYWSTQLEYCCSWFTAFHTSYLPLTSSGWCTSWCWYFWWSCLQSDTVRSSPTTFKRHNS